MGDAGPSCLDAADTDDSGAIDITDGIYLLNFLFLGGLSPPPPFSDCGGDPTDGDTLDCKEFGSDKCDDPIELIDPQTPGYAQLGAGYDVFTAYADTEFVRNKILNLDALNRAGQLRKFPVDKLSVSQFQGTTMDSYVEALSVSVGLSGSYKFFSGSINTIMSQMASVTTEWSFATVQVKHRVHELAVVRMQTAELRKYLAPDFAGHINSQLDPAVLFSLYGTHVIGKLVAGGRLDYHLSALITNQEQKQKIGAYAEAKFDDGFSSVQLNTSFDYETYKSNYVANEDFALSSVGGRGKASRVWTDGDYTAWVDEVLQNPIFCDFGAEPWLIPIWELANGALANGDCAAGSRCWEIHEAYKVYAQSKRIDLPGRKVLVDVAVTLDNPSTETGFEPLRDYEGSSAQAYVNKGVSSARTPNRQSDGIMAATKLWISYKATSEDQAIEAPIDGVHLNTGDDDDDLEDQLFNTHTRLRMMVGDQNKRADFSHDTCQKVDQWEDTPCPTSLCAYDCDNIHYPLQR